MTQIEMEAYSAVIQYCRNGRKSKMERQDEYVANAAKDIFCALIAKNYTPNEVTMKQAVDLAVKLSENFFTK